jgi:SOUL heme-binding protein
MARKSTVAAILGLLASTVGASAVEEPSYRLVLREGSFEIRDYPSLVIAEVTEPGDRNSAAYSGFRKLAGYIFGNNVGKQSIEMTAPVIEARPADWLPSVSSAEHSAASAWTIQFIMPHDMSFSSLPKPDSGDIRLKETRPARIAVLRFSGWATDSSVSEHTAELEQAVHSRKLTPIGPAVIAQYDPPWTLPFLRRNEILLPIEK